MSDHHEEHVTDPHDPLVAELAEPALRGGEGAPPAFPGPLIQARPVHSRTREAVDESTTTVDVTTGSVEVPVGPAECLPKPLRNGRAAP